MRKPGDASAAARASEASRAGEAQLLSFLQRLNEQASRGVRHRDSDRFQFRRRLDETLERFCRRGHDATAPPSCLRRPESVACPE